MSNGNPDFIDLSDEDNVTNESRNDANTSMTPKSLSDFENINKAHSSLLPNYCNVNLNKGQSLETVNSAKSNQPINENDKVNPFLHIFNQMEAPEAGLTKDSTPETNNANAKDTQVKINVADIVGKKRLLAKDTSAADSDKLKLSKKAKHVHDLVGVILKEYDASAEPASSSKNLEIERLQNQMVKFDKAINFFVENYTSNKMLREQLTIFGQNFNTIFTKFQRSINEVQQKIEVLLQNKPDHNRTFVQGGLTDQNLSTVIAHVQRINNEITNIRKHLKNNDTVNSHKNSSFDVQIHKLQKDMSKLTKALRKDVVTVFQDINKNGNEKIEGRLKAIVNEMDEKMKKITMGYGSKINSLEARIDTLEPTAKPKYQDLPFKAVLYLKNYTQKLESEVNADILFKPIIDYCLKYGVFLKHQKINDGDYLLTAKEGSKVIFKVPFVFENLTLKCAPIAGYTLWQCPVMLSAEYRTSMVYDYVTKYSSEIIFSIFLERDLEDVKRLYRCKELFEKSNLFNNTQLYEERVIRKLIELLDRDDDLQQIRVSKTVLYKKPRLIKKIFSGVDEKYMMDLESRNRVVLECVKFHRSAARYNSLEDYKKYEPSKSVSENEDELNSYRLWTMFPEYASELKKND